MNILKYLIGNIFRSYEKQLIEKVILELENISLKEKLTAQCNSINKIQRIDKNREVNMYCIRKGRPFLDDSIKIKTDKEEIEFATVQYFVKKDIINKASLWLVNGFIFSLTFSKDPAILEKISYEIVINLNYKDRLHDDARTRMNKASKNNIRNFFGEKFEVSEVLDVFDVFEDKTFIPRGMPLDWKEMVEIFDGFNTKNVRVYGIKNLRHISIDGKTYYVIAESSQTMLFIEKKDSFEEKIFFKDVGGDDNNIHVFANNYRQSIVKFIKEEKERCNDNFH